jgi:hypothetical protein
LVAGRKLKFLGTTLSILPGESSNLTDFTGPNHVVLDIPGGVEVSGAKQPALYLVVGLRPAMV